MALEDATIQAAGQLPAPTASPETVSQEDVELHRSAACWTVEEAGWKQVLPNLPDEVIALLAPPIVVCAHPSRTPNTPWIAQARTLEVRATDRNAGPMARVAAGSSVSSVPLMTAGRRPARHRAGV